MAKMKIKPVAKKGTVSVKLLIQKQKMMGREEGKTKKQKVDFLTHMTATVNGVLIWEASTGPFLSHNPYMQFSFDVEKSGVKKGDKLTVVTVDNNGNINKASKKIKFK